MARKVTDDKHYKNIAAALRQSCPSISAIPPNDMADSIHLACRHQYELGVANERDRFWDEIQNFGQRTRYDFAFRFWGGEYIRPKYVVKPGSGTQDTKGMFQSNQSVKIIEAQYFDLSRIYTTLGSSNSTDSVYAMFNACSALEYIQDIRIPATSYFGTWANCSSLHTIDIIRCSKTTYFNSAFINCSALQNVVFRGEIAQTGLDLHWSTALSHDSICSVLQCLSADASGKSVTLSLTAVNAVFETAPGINDGAQSEAWAQLAATKSNWNIHLT